MVRTSARYKFNAMVSAARKADPPLLYIITSTQKGWWWTQGSRYPDTESGGSWSRKGLFPITQSCNSSHIKTPAVIDITRKWTRRQQGWGQIHS